MYQWNIYCSISASSFDEKVKDGGVSWYVTEPKVEVQGCKEICQSKCPQLAGLQLRTGRFKAMRYFYHCVSKACITCEACTVDNWYTGEFEVEFFKIRSPGGM